MEHALNGKVDVPTGKGTLGVSGQLKIIIQHSGGWVKRWPVQKSVDWS